jgi:hypothetical protein
MQLPEDIIKNVTRENALELFDEYMVRFQDNSDIEEDYVWKPCVMREFIKAILK